MADDIDELLDEVESKYIQSSENGTNKSQKSGAGSKQNETYEPVELDEAIQSICSIPEPIETTSLISDALLPLEKETKRRCTVVYVGDSTSASGLSGGVTQSACNNLRCTSCDFKVSIFRDFLWDPTTSYLFLRNNMPDFEKIRSKLKIYKGYCAYGCQCHAISVNSLMELRKDLRAKWVCVGH